MGKIGSLGLRVGKIGSLEFWEGKRKSGLKLE